MKRNEIILLGSDTDGCGFPVTSRLSETQK